jgi:hypothetical protein
MTATATFDSYSDNEEDVVLWRALRSYDPGRYVEINHLHSSGNVPASGREDTSPTRALYERGWSGLLVTSDVELSARRKASRPRDVTVVGKASPRDEPANPEETADWRVSALLGDLGWDATDLHAMIVEIESDATAALEGAALARWRPWIVVVGASTRADPRYRAGLVSLMSRDGYDHTMFDGQSFWFVAKEHAQALADKLSYPARPFDGHTSRAQRTLNARIVELEASVAGLSDDVAAWRSKAVSAWAAERCALADKDDAAARFSAQVEAVTEAARAQLEEISRLRGELADLRSSTSWQVTAPLRRATSVLKRTT